MLKYITNNIGKLTKNEKKHILGILLNNTKYTKNNDGYLFDLSELDDVILNKIAECVKLILDNRILIDKKDRERKCQLEEYTRLMQEKLNETKERELLEYSSMLTLTDSPNITMVLSRKNLGEYKDPDILMNEYIESQKVKPGSKYYDISRVIKNIRKSDVVEEYTMDHVIEEDELLIEEDALEHEPEQELEVNMETMDDKDILESLGILNTVDDSDDDDVSDTSSIEEYKRLMEDMGFETEVKKEPLVYQEYIEW